ncbi:site-2 protease family protein [Oscillospiraceae bacterium MB08-C2-2]|nr:site-2 protease family protein [Oscillospiraceae bacterium MB08-C2-2]
MEFTLLKVRWRLSFWFFALLAFAALVNRGFLLLYIAVPILIHECGHLLIMAFWKVPVEAVSLGLFSIDIQRSRQRSLSYGGEILLHLAGPAVNLLAAAALYAWAFPSLRVQFMVAVNLVTGLFNLLPIGNLDGGQVMRLLTQRLWGPGLSHRISRAVSVLVLAPLFGISLLLVFRRGENIMLLVACLYLAANIISQRD